jgi:hypothetical protein
MAQLILYEYTAYSQKFEGSRVSLKTPPVAPGGLIFSCPNLKIVGPIVFRSEKVLAETAGRTLYLCGFVLQTLVTRGVDFDNFVA